MPERPMRTEPRAPLNYDDLFANASWMRRLAVSLVSDEALADDIVQDSFLVAIKRPPVHSNSLTGWLTAVVRTMAFRKRRQHQRRFRLVFAAARPEIFDAASDGAFYRF